MKSKKILVFLVISIFIITAATSMIFAQGEKITVSGGTIGGTSNLAASGMAAIGQQYCNLLPTVVTNPTMAQVNILENHEANIATTPGYLTYNAYYGLGKWKDKPFSELRTLTDRPNCQMQFVVLQNSEIKEIKDLVGKTVIMGKKGFTAAELGQALFEALGITLNDITPLYLGHSDAIAAIVSGKADAYLVTGAFPHSKIIELSEMQSAGVRLLNINEEDMKTILEKCPYFQPRVIGPVYKGMDGEITAAEYQNVYGCVDLSEETAYNLTKNFWEHLDFATLQWSALANLKLENTSSIRGVAPWHIGAYRYYKEVGLEIPEDMIPPEAK